MKRILSVVIALVVIALVYIFFFNGNTTFTPEENPTPIATNTEEEQKPLVVIESNPVKSQALENGFDPESISSEPPKVKNDGQKIKVGDITVEFPRKFDEKSKVKCEGGENSMCPQGFYTQGYSAKIDILTIENGTDHILFKSQGEYTPVIVESSPSAGIFEMMRDGDVYSYALAIVLENGTGIIAVSENEGDLLSLADDVVIK